MSQNHPKTIWKMSPCRSPKKNPVKQSSSTHLEADPRKNTIVRNFQTHVQATTICEMNLPHPSPKKHNHSSQSCFSIQRRKHTRNFSKQSRPNVRSMNSRTIFCSLSAHFPPIGLLLHLVRHGADTADADTAARGSPRNFAWRASEEILVQLGLRRAWGLSGLGLSLGLGPLGWHGIP